MTNSHKISSMAHFSENEIILLIERFNLFISVFQSATNYFSSSYQVMVI